MRKIGYGISNFAEFPKRDYFFVDKTPFLHKLEDLGEKYLFFMRPRRFGKSLWISLLQHYYGIQYKDQFQALFGKYYVGIHPTPEANTYFILRFDFSRIDSSTVEKAYFGFLENVRAACRQFVEDYEPYLKKELIADIFTADSPENTLKRFFSVIPNRAGHAIYVLIDEYDQFSNDLIAFNLTHFREIVGRNGWVRKFYETIKTATGMGTVERIFVTGVAPATLDSLTSGFNISVDLTRDVRFHEMFGVNEAELREILAFIGITEQKMPHILAQMKLWYDGFKMDEGNAAHIYNPDMVLFFAKEYAKFGDMPRKMLDENIATDYSKLRNIFKIDNEEHKRRRVLLDLIEKGFVRSEITSRFNFELEFGEQEFISLLFYMGLLSIHSIDLGRVQLQIPNYVIKSLYFQYFYQLLRESELTPVGSNEVAEIVYQFAKYNHTEPLKELISNILKAHSVRDRAKFSEKHLKTIFITLFYITNVYIVDSEPETQQTYMDVLLMGKKELNVPYNYLFELKYFKKPAKLKGEEEKTWLAQIKQDTIHQLNEYRKTDKIRNVARLKSYILIVVNLKLTFFEEVE